MEENKKLTLASLESDLLTELNELNDRKEEIVLYQYGQDIIDEIVDGTIPTYNHDLLDVIASQPWLGETESEIGGNTVNEVARGVILTHLLELANTWLEDAKEEVKEQLENKITELKDWKIHFNGGNDTPEYKLKNQELEDTKSKLKDWQEIHG